MHTFFKKGNAAIIAVIIAALALALGIVAISTRHVDAPVQNTDTEELGGLSHTTSDLRIGTTTNAQTRKNLEVTGTTTLSTYYTMGGIDYAAVQVPMASATSTYLCRVSNPWPAATSTLLSFTANVTTGVTGAVVASLSTTTASGGYGSSSPAILLDHTIASGGIDMVIWLPNSATTSPGVLGMITAKGESNNIIAPNTLLSYRIATTSAGTYATSWVGNCSYVFMKP